MVLLKNVKNNSNEAQFIPRQVKNNIKRMEMEQELYSKVIRIR